MMFEDPPTHTLLRGLMSRVFTPRRMAEIEDQIRRYCVHCLDPLVGSGGFDIISALAAMMPMRVIGMLLGIPESEQVSVRDANDANLRTQPGTPMKVVNADKIADGRIYADYVEWRSHNPSDDLMTALLNVEFTDEQGSAAQADPQRGSALHPGGRRGGQRDDRPADRLAGQGAGRTSRPAPRDRRGPVTAAAGRRRDAALRADRTARRPLHGNGFRVLRHDSACRQRRCCCCSVPPTATSGDTRDPDTFDIRRDNISHLTFGKGLHYCLGANLARLEGRVALDELLNRWPEWDIDYDSARLAPTSTVRGWEHLRVLVG